MLNKDKITYKDIIRFSCNYWFKRPVFFAVTAFLISLAAVVDSIFPVVTGHLIDTVVSTDWKDANIDLLAFLPRAVVIALIFLLVVELAYHGIRNAAYFLWNKAAVNILEEITQDLFYKVQRFSADWHANSFAGGTVRKITRAMWSFDTFEDICILYLLPTAIVMVSVVVGMFFHWTIMGFVTLFAVVIYIAISLWTVLFINAKHFKKSAKADTDVGAAIADAITSNNTVKSFGSEEKEDILFKNVTHNWRCIALKSWQIANWTDLLRRYISGIMMFVMIGTALWLWSKGRADAGDIVYVFTSFIVLSAYLRHIGEQVANMQRAVSEMEDGVSYWKRKDNVVDIDGAKDFIPAKGRIVFDKVCFSYDEEQENIYNNFSIEINAGERIALVGYSGSGKSTFVKLLQRFYDIQSGEIRIDGQNIAKITQRSLRRSISLVPQDPILFHRKLSDNIAYGRSNASMDDIINASRQAYAHDFITKLPDGYNTLVGERGVKLSGGERQRVALARAILSNNNILVLDEATSSLDSASEHYIQKALEKISCGKTTITIAHRLSTIKNVDRILVFDNGKIVEQGTHDQLIKKNNSHYKHLYDMQVTDLLGD